jgi:phosphatidylglycerophosphatase A
MENKQLEYHNPHLIFSTFFGVGFLLRKGSGTLGSLIGLALGLALLQLAKYFNNLIFPSFNVLNQLFLGLTFLLFITIAAIYSADKYSKLTNSKDASEIISDEIVGQALAFLITVPLSANFLAISVKSYEVFISFFDYFILSSFAIFILFRLFDIFKPWPICWFDKNISGGLGIILDDLIAALFASISFYFIFFFIVIDKLLS